MKNNWEIEELKKIIEEKITELIQCERYLFTIDAGEQTISHRLATRLENVFCGYNIDCEYNKHLESVKTFCGPLTNTCCVCKERKTGSFRPDIIVHRRTTDESNLIVIEVKKNHDCEFDKNKLKELTKKEGKYKYKLGVFVQFNGADKPTIKFISDDENYAK